jgi:hypothetical protein
LPPPNHYPLGSPLRNGQFGHIDNNFYFQTYNPHYATSHTCHMEIFGFLLLGRNSISHMVGNYHLQQVFWKGRMLEASIAFSIRGNS